MCRPSAGAVAAAGLLFLAGCSANQHKVVAEINHEVITDDVYNERVQSVTSIPETLNTDAGGVTMVNMIRDRLTEQLAKQHHALPRQDYVDAAAEYQIRMDPQTAAAIAAGKLSREELKRQKNFELSAFNIGTDGDTPSQAEIDKVYNEYKDKPDFRVKANYVVKILQVPDEATGRKVLADLKQTGDFKGIAQRGLGLSAADAANAAKDQTMIAEQLRPELRQALDKLKPNEFTPEPVAISVANQQQPLNPQMVYAVAQLKHKDPEHLLTKSEVGFLLAPLVLQKTHPDWKEHYRRELAEFTKKSQIRIAIPKYEGLVDSFVRPLASEEASGHPTQGMPTPQPGAIQ